MRIKVLSWNIWKGKHLDQVIELLHKEQAQIIGLQEIIQSAGIPNQAQVLAQTLGYEFLYCPIFKTDRHDPPFEIGNAFLSKLPILESSCHILSGLDSYKKDAETEPRGASEILLQIGNRKLRFINTHLAYSHKLEDNPLRILQLNKLLQVAESQNTVLMGDFNSLPDSDVIKKLDEKLINVDPNPREYSWTDFHDPSNPKYRIDYIFTSKDIETVDFEILDSLASDHRPLKAQLEF